MITLIILIAVVGFLVYLITTYVPMPQPFRLAIIGIAVLLLLIYVMRALGVSDIPLR